MRSRGSYRVQIPNGITNKTKCVDIGEDNDNEVIDITEENKNKNKRSKCDISQQMDENIIIIDSDDESEDIQMIDFDVHTSRSAVLPVKKPFQMPNIKKCLKCFRLLPSDFSKDNDYNRLTSADFYHNPRIHPSVISIELKDRTRINCFEESISKNKQLFENNTVLIIGSLTGLLALLVAKAKAKNVIIYDSAGVSQVIQCVIDNNKWRLPNKTNFFIIRNSIEEYILPNGLKRVDVIVSDWVNHSLFYKSMIISFIKARNKWLRKGGVVFPDKANLYIAGAHDHIHKHVTKDKRYSTSLYVKRIDYWDKNLYGFDMRAVRRRVVLEPIHENVSKSQVITNEFLIKSYDLYELSLQDINFELPFHLKAIKDHYLQTFVLFFDVIFSKHNTFPIMYSTRPTAYKHMFRPTLLFIESDKQITVEKSDEIKGSLKYQLSEDLNEMSIDIEFKFKNQFFDVEEELLFSTK